MELYGQSFDRRELEALGGRMEQFGGARRYRTAEGPGDGVEQIHVRTGAGLSLFVSPHRGLDIGATEFAGAPIAWMAPGGIPHPAHFEEPGLGWLRTAAGGLLMTCGLRQVGAPCEDEGEALGIHGRAHHTVADEVAVSNAWEDGQYVSRVRGIVREARLFGEHLVLDRTIETRLGENVVRIRDRVENLGFRTEPFMLLYHFNFGFPLLGPGVGLRFPSRRVEPREKTTPLDGFDRWDPPVADYFERVYFHSEIESAPDALTGQPMAEAVIASPGFPLPGVAAGSGVEVALRWGTGTLPHLTQWKMCGAGAHVLGIEPGNCLTLGRAGERAAGRLQLLEPGEAREHLLDLSVRILPA